MKVIVTHTSPDWDAITSVWFLKKFLPGWEEAKLNFVPAGTKLSNPKSQIPNPKFDPIENLGADEVIHVDTGLGPLDHHQTSDMAVCAASLCFDYIRVKSSELKVQSDRIKTRLAALQRIVAYVVALDHFQEVFWPDAAADTYEFGMFGILEGYKAQYPNSDEKYVTFGMVLLDAMMHRMEQRIWAEHELKTKAKEFATRYGKGLAIETLNDETIKLAQKIGYVLVVRKDPRKGYVRIKARPQQASQKNYSSSDTTLAGESRSIQKNSSRQARTIKQSIDLTLVKEKLAKMDPKATWFLHVSKKMLLNGTPKNPKMIPTTLSLQQIVEVVKNI